MYENRTIENRTTQLIEIVLRKGEERYRRKKEEVNLRYIVSTYVNVTMSFLCNNMLIKIIKNKII
jgi:hypothetical protein